jgi:hypothetical protein
MASVDSFMEAVMRLEQRNIEEVVATCEEHSHLFTPFERGLIRQAREDILAGTYPDPQDCQDLRWMLDRI